LAYAQDATAFRLFFLIYSTTASISCPQRPWPRSSGAYRHERCR
jgi:hypothetical protein